MAATETREVRAEAKWVRSSARKARLVLEHIRGRSVPEARTVLAFSERAVARDIERVLRSAVANAEANHGLVGDELVVSAAYADEGPTLKRWRARARGRVARIKKRTCHIAISLALPGEETIPEPVAPPPTPAAEEEKPKRQPRKQAEPVVEETETAEETPAKEKPKTRKPRAAKPKAEKPKTKATEKPKRTTRKKKED
jgi:large subunit ribosomal protein L22